MSAKHPVLFDVPKDAPSRDELLATFKAAQQIETHHARHLAREDMPWCACLMSEAREMMHDYGHSRSADLAECVAHIGTRLEDCNLLEYGRTEREAIDALCQAQDLPKFNVEKP